MSLVDQKRNFNKMKHGLEPWRNIIILVDSLLGWEKKFYPAVIFGSVSLVYFILWCLDLSVITTFSLMAWSCVLMELICPAVTRMLCNNENWTGKEEARFDRIVQQLFNMKLQLISWYNFAFNNPERKSTVSMVIISIILLGLAWIGAIFNNLLLMYIVTMTAIMYPGIRQNEILKHFKETLTSLCQTKMQRFGDRINKKDE